MIKYLCAFLFLCSCYIHSQTEDRELLFQNAPLSDALQKIEDIFNVKFSYLDENIYNKTITLKFDPEQGITNLLQQLEQHTHLKFTQTGTNYYTIRRLKNDDLISICGYIRNELEEPLANIEIFIKSQRINIRTDEHGFFKKEAVPFGSAILLSAPGFRQRVLKGEDFHNQNCLTIYLVETIERLEEILIKEYLSKGITKKGNKITIDTEELKILPGLTEPDLLQSIQLAPGVNSPFETASGIYVRGSVPHQNLVLWNGIKTYHQGHMFGMLSAFNPYAVKKVDFYKNGVSATYGDRIAGVIDIQSDSEIATDFSGNAGINLVNADAIIHTPIIYDKLSLQVSGRRSYTNFMETPTFDKLSERVFQNTTVNQASSLQNDDNDFYYEDFNARINLKLSEYSTLNLNSLYSNNNLDFSRKNDTLQLRDDLRTENEGYNLQWKYGYTKNFSHTISSYYSKYLLNYQFITTNNNAFVENERKNNSVQDYGAKLITNYKISEHNSFISGYEYSNNSIKYAFVTTTPDFELVLDEDNRTLNTHSLFTAYVYDLPKSIRFHLGARANYYQELDKLFVEPRVQINKYLSPHLQLSASGEYRTQALSQIRESVVSDLSLENQVWTLSDDEQFPVIKSYQFTLGSSFNKNKWFIDLEAYYKKIDDITTLTAGFINPIDNTYNIGESSIYGADIFVKKHFNNYKSWISYSYINTKNRFEDINNNNEFPGNWNIEHTIKWSHFYTLNNFQFSLGWLWHTGKAFTNVSGVTQQGDILFLDFGEINSSNLPLYHRLDFSAIYDFKLGNNDRVSYRMGASVLNLYNRKNLLNREFRITNSLDTRFVNDDIYALGITPNISFRVFW